MYSMVMIYKVIQNFPKKSNVAFSFSHYWRWNLNFDLVIILKVWNDCLNMCNILFQKFNAVFWLSGVFILLTSVANN
jgi:hypothetical protein